MIRMMTLLHRYWKVMMMSHAHTHYSPSGHCCQTVRLSDCQVTLQYSGGAENEMGAACSTVATEYSRKPGGEVTRGQAGR